MRCPARLSCPQLSTDAGVPRHFNLLLSLAVYVDMKARRLRLARRPLTCWTNE